MPRGHHVPLYDKVVAAVENLLALRACHMADGEVTPDEEQVELEYVTGVLLPIAVYNSESSHMAHAIHRYGPDVDSVNRMFTRRQRRRAEAPVPVLEDVICLA